MNYLLSEIGTCNWNTCHLIWKFIFCGNSHMVSCQHICIYHERIFKCSNMGGCYFTMEYLQFKGVSQSLNSWLLTLWSQHHSLAPSSITTWKEYWNQERKLPWHFKYLKHNHINILTLFFDSASHKKFCYFFLKGESVYFVHHFLIWLKIISWSRLLILIVLLSCCAHPVCKITATPAPFLVMLNYFDLIS